MFGPYRNPRGKTALWYLNNTKPPKPWSFSYYAEYMLHDKEHCKGMYDGVECDRHQKEGAGDATQ